MLSNNLHAIPAVRKNGLWFVEVAMNILCSFVEKTLDVIRFAALDSGRLKGRTSVMR